MKYSITILPLIFNLSFLFGQVDNTNFIYLGKTDSVTLAIYHFNDKELQEMPTTDTNNEPTEEFKLIKSKHLKPSDITMLNKKILKKSSFKLKRALLNHFNILINYYNKDTLVQYIEISTLTANITIQKNGCNYIAPTHTDTPAEIERKYSVTDTCLFRYQVSNSFGKYLKKSLIHYDLWKYIEEVYKLKITDAKMSDQ